MISRINTDMMNNNIMDDKKFEFILKLISVDPQKQSAAPFTDLSTNKSFKLIDLEIRPSCQGFFLVQADEEILLADGDYLLTPKCHFQVHISQREITTKADSYGHQVIEPLWEHNKLDDLSAANLFSELLPAQPDQINDPLEFLYPRDERRWRYADPLIPTASGFTALQDNSRITCQSPLPFLPEHKLDPMISNTYDAQSPMDRLDEFLQNNIEEQENSILENNDQQNDLQFLTNQSMVSILKKRLLHNFSK